jgi:hypothetical protein
MYKFCAGSLENGTQALPIKDFQSTRGRHRYVNKLMHCTTAAVAMEVYKCTEKLGMVAHPAIIVLGQQR